MNHDDANLLVAQSRIKFRCFAQEIVHCAGRFCAGKSAARDHEGEPLTARGRIVLERCFLQKRHHAISQQRRVAQSLHRHRPVADADVLEEVRLGAEREEQMIKTKLELSAPSSPCTQRILRAPDRSPALRPRSR